MKFNKKIFLVFLLLILIVPQGVSASSDAMLDDGNDLTIGSYHQDTVRSISDGSSDGSIYNSIDFSIDDHISDSNYFVEDIGSDRNNEDISENNPYLVSENIDNRLSNDELSNDGLNSIERGSGSDSVLNSIDLGSIDDTVVNADLNLIESSNVLKDENTFNIFIISDNTGNNLFDAVSCEILDNSSFSNVKISIRSGNQINAMSEEEIYDLLASCDAFIGQWVSSNVDAVLTSIIGKYPTLSDKKLFLLLESPTGNINSGSSSLNLIRNCTINYEKIFSSFSNDVLVDYYQNTKRGTNFEEVFDYIENHGSSFGDVFNNLVLYKDINDKGNLKNELLYILNFLGHDCQYEEPNFTGVQASGIFRDRWYSLDEYIETFFNQSNNRTIGILESNMYIQSQQLDLVNKITESLEAKGYNVIPIYCPAGNAEQLNIMIRYWTSAGSNITGFLDNPEKFDINVDAIIS
ncbi:MAG: cobaltochelatase subunit CobN, partial [Methanobrevibacter sp.]|nr:cobaltochelatase subunit CobN [Methanobrevibacter sp.]